MPLTEKGHKILKAMQEEYGEEKGKQVFYASKNAGKITGVDSDEDEQTMDKPRPKVFVEVRKRTKDMNLEEMPSSSNISYGGSTLASRSIGSESGGGSSGGGYGGPLGGSSGPGSGGSTGSGREEQFE